MDDIKASLNALIQKQGGVQNIKDTLSSSNIPLDDHKAAVETAFREQLQSYSVSRYQKSGSGADKYTQSMRSSAPQFTDGKVSDEYHVGLLSRLEILVELLKGELIQPNSVVPIVSDTLDIHTLSSATVIFNFLTDFMASDDSNVVKTTSTRNNLLKTSNELLRRASRTRNSELCGEILLFLTSIMPLTDRSATNFRGDIRESAKTIPDELMNSDEADDGYRNFWRLQAYLTNPMLIYNKTPVKDEGKDEETTHTERFKDLFSYILQLLVEASDKEIKMSGSKSATGGGTKRKLNETEVQSDAYFFPEYLAQPKLFPLQVADPSFRCCVFIQMFIIVQFITSVLPKELLRGPEIQNPQEKIIKSGIQSDQSLCDWAQSRRANILKTLRKVSPHGMDVAAPIAQLMKRERHWVYWKMENCPMIELPSADTALLDKAEESRMANIFKSVNPSPYAWGTEALTESFEEGYVNADDLEDAPRPPDLSFYVKKAKLDSFKANQRKAQLGLAKDEPVPEGDAVLEELKNHKQSLSWRGFRCVAKSSAPVIASLPPGSDVEGLFEAIEKKKQQSQARGGVSKDSSPNTSVDVTQLVGDGQRHEEGDGDGDGDHEEPAKEKEEQEEQKQEEEEEMNIEQHLGQEEADGGVATVETKEEVIEQDGQVLERTEEVASTQVSQPADAEAATQVVEQVHSESTQKMEVEDASNVAGDDQMQT
ncbi:hypothetical protein E3P99_00859 [Wallemia hederae]|uniref:THO complex subunit 1 n=1 Tax=Wallemia hederae TaxID=1540922 RepID=A0A4T0FT80_9BASI|nr:hypothetical protein E3P99_00859 [Wallemia hederae]